MKQIKYYFLLSFLIFTPLQIGAADFDTDGDGLSDIREQTIYFTDINNPDTDGDGFSDGEEINSHYSPHQANKTLSQTDLDNDGLSDWLELLFNTSLNNPDSDGDGYNDYQEILNSYDPLSAGENKLAQRIVIDAGKQSLTAYLDNKPLVIFPISSGKAGYATPVGEYQINNKNKRAWSKNYGLWMPYWMSFIGNTYGIHELPEWPGGYKEGQDHLGQAVSHGCVRLGVGPAEWLYNWAEVGTEVKVME